MSLVYDQNNIFAKILRNEIACIEVYEDEIAMAFMDVMPQGPGHTLVIPREPSRNILDANPDTLSSVIKIVQKISLAVKTAFSADGITLLQFNEQAAGQSVYHLHFHIIPRFENIPLHGHMETPANMDELKKNAEKIQEALRITQ